MLSPEYLLRVTEGAEEIASQLHTSILKRITERIAIRMRRGDEHLLNSIDKWQIETLLESGYLRDDIAADIARATGLEAEEIKEAFEDAGVEAIKNDNKVYKAAGIPQELKLSPYMTRLMQRNYDATLGAWENLTRTTADATEQLFRSTLDKAYNAVTSGELSYTQAYIEAIEALAENQLTITYPSGHTDTIETAVLRALRTGVSQSAAQIQLARMDELGIDLVLVSSHMGARPSHQVWQGKIYSRSGTSKKYPAFSPSTGYGTGAGLCGWNCRHHFSPYFEGQGNPYERYDDKKNKELYEQTQHQRSMERGIRKSKREADVLQTAINNTDNQEVKDGLSAKLTDVKKRLRDQSKAYKDYCNEHDLRPLPERLRIAKSGGVGKVAEATVAEPQAPIIPTFTPAKTIDEAQEYAERFVSQYKSTYSGNVSYKGIDISVANKANEVFNRVFAEYDIEPLRNITPMNMREKRWKDTTADAAYQWIQGGDMFINPKYYKTQKTIEAHIKEGNDLLEQVLGGAERYIASGRAKPAQIEYLEALMTSGRQCVAQTHDYVESTIVHECGHMLDDKVFRKVLKSQGVDVRTFLQESMAKYGKRISGYANSSTNEYIAECFAAYWNGETGILDPDIVKLFEDAKVWKP